ncbi:MAG: DUF3160 domain-containing protein [Chitinophagales bacterium]
MLYWKKKGSIITVILLVAFVVSGCGQAEGPKKQENKKESTPTAQAANFASYRELAVNVNPSIKPYKVANDLSNVTNRERFEFSPGAQSLLTQNGFVVTSGMNPEFFIVYENNRYDSVPNFVTTDAMLHNYHLFFNHLLKSVETKYLAPELKQLGTDMLAESVKQYQELKGTEWENAALRNMAFFGVACRLMNPKATVPPQVQTVVDRELKLIEDHKDGAALSPVMNLGQAKADIQEGLKEDYTQYIPRGHYTKTEELKKYFKTMMWYGRLTFRLKDEDETRSAALITMALNQGDNYTTWEKIYQPTNFFVGKSDDLGYYQYVTLVKKIYGNTPDLQKAAADKAKWKTFIREASRLEPPAINSVPVFDKNIQPDREKEIKGFRFMGQRYTLDADVFQRLVYREVDENSQGERRVLPKGLDIPAAMGSDEAYKILDSMGETNYSNYPQNMKKMQSKISGLKRGFWSQNLYSNWLYTLLPLLNAKPAGYPSFMLNEAWTRKELATYLGNWTELKHDTVLYAKQVYAEMGGGEEEYDDRGYVEPNPELYARLASLSAMTAEGLKARGMLEKTDQESLGRLEKLAVSLKTISEKELNNKDLSKDEYELIRTFGGQLEHFWYEALRDDNVTSRSQLWENPAALVADVATAPPDTVLEEGTGYINNIYVVVPVDGKLRIARGAVFSYYEFPWAANDRLTDRKWQEMLQNGKAPAAPEWTRVFTDNGESRIIYPGE